MTEDPAPRIRPSIGATLAFGSVIVIAAAAVLAGGRIVPPAAVLLGPLIASALSSVVVTTAVALFATGLASLVIAELPYDTEAGLFRLGIIAVGGAVAICISWTRVRRERELEQAQRVARLAGLQAITAAVAQAASPREVAGIVAREGRGVLAADTGLVYELAPGGDTLELLAAVGYGNDALAEWREIPVDTAAPVTDVIRMRQPLVLESREEIDERYPYLRDNPNLADSALVALPLVADGETLGGVFFGLRGPHSFTADERRLVQTMTDQCAGALQRARLFDAEARARDRAERLNERLGRLQAATAALATAVTQDEVAFVVVDQVRSALRAAGAVLATSTDEGNVLEVRAANGSLSHVAQARVPAESNLALTEAFRTDEPLWFADRTAWENRYGTLDDAPEYVGPGGVLPLVVYGRTLGVLGVAFDGAPAEPEDRMLAITLADQAAQALDRARLFEVERDLASTLQHSLLPPPAPKSAEYSIATRYQPAVETIDVGGDWYDVIPRPDGRVGVVVGDVVGRGIAAAAAMGQLRSALGALALVTDSPAGVLEALDGFAARTEGATSATVAYVLVDPTGGRVRYCCAGHPPPLVLRPDGITEFLDAAVSWPLDAVEGMSRIEAEQDIAPGSTLIMYTDGLIERRGESLELGLERLAQAVAARVGMDPDELGDELVSALLHGHHQADDLAVLVLQLHPVAPDLFARAVPARADELRHLRAELRQWLEAGDVPADDAHDLVVACSEAASNAIEHAYAFDGARDVLVRCRRDGSDLLVEVQDRGRWREPIAGSHRGRGIPLMRALLNDVDVRHDAGGTTVLLRHRIARSLSGE